MKKTKKHFSIVAFFLAAVMLLSACSFAAPIYRTADPRAYIAFKDGFDLERVLQGSDTVFDKMTVKDSDVTAHINNLLYALRETVADGTNKPGAFAKYDVLSVRNFIYDMDGNLISSNFAPSKKLSSAATGTINLNDALSLPLGYGDGVNTALLLSLEKALFLDPDAPLNVEDYLVTYRGIGGEKIGAFGAMPSVAYLTYSSTYTSWAGTDQNGSKGTDVLAHFQKIAENIAKEGQGTNDYKEAIYLGLKDLIERRDEDNPYTPNATGAVTIYVYPTEDAAELAGKMPEADEAYIAYDIDFLDGGADYMQGKIMVTLTGAVAENSYMTNPDAGAFISRYKYPSDETGTYRCMVYGEEKELALKDRDVVVYSYIFERAACTRPEYNADTVKNKLGFETDETADGAVITAYEADVKKTLQDACDAEAKKTVTDALWEVVLENTLLIKEPEEYINSYRREALGAAISQWEEGGYSELETSSGKKWFENEEDFILSYYYAVISPMRDAEGRIIHFSTMEALETALYEEGRTVAKERLLAYYIADALGCRYTDEELSSMKKMYGEAWAKEQLEEGRKALLEYYTPESLEKNYPDSGKQELFAQYGATSYEECLDKMLKETKCSSWEEFARKSYSDGSITVEDYVIYMGGESTLYDIYQHERSLDALYKRNLGTLCFEEIPYAVPKDAASLGQEEDFSQSGDGMIVFPGSGVNPGGGMVALPSVSVMPK